MGVITNINGLNNEAPTGGYCGGALFGLVPTPLSGFFGDVYNNIVPRDAISGINGITDTNPLDIVVGGHPFGTNCLWHKVRYNGPFVELADACEVTGSAGAATEARTGHQTKFMLVHAKTGSSDPLPVPSEAMWYTTASEFATFEWVGIPPLISFPSPGYYILWGKYGIDDAGVNFKLVQFEGTQSPTNVSVKSVCSF